MLQSALLVGAAGLLILLSPPPPAFQRPLICADVQFVGRVAHILVNCDAGDYLKFAVHPARLLEKGATRQTRPGYAALGWIFSLPFRALESITGNPFYAGYVALNFLLLIASAFMLQRLTGVSSLLSPSTIVPTAILLVNHITKAFLWTPHLQVMSVFVAMLAIVTASQVISGRIRLTLMTSIILGLSSGLACLVYGAFVLVPATATIALWVFVRPDRIAGGILRTLTLWGCVALPLIAWTSFVVYTTGSFYSHETEYYHEFVWIAEEWRAGRLATAVLHNLAGFGETLPRALAVPLAFLGAALALGRARKPLSSSEDQKPAVAASVAFLAAAIPFYALMGLYDPRLTATLLPPFLVVTALLSRDGLTTTRTLRGPEPITIAAIGYVAIVILLPGPYS